MARRVRNDKKLRELYYLNDLVVVRHDAKLLKLAMADLLLRNDETLPTPPGARP